jgi:hypothetical protein
VFSCGLESLDLTFELVLTVDLDLNQGLQLLKLACLLGVPRYDKTDQWKAL